MVGAKIIDLMLEHRRVARLFPFAKGERNFHVFYDMFANGLFNREERERYGMLDSTRAYKYLQPGIGTRPKKSVQHVEQGSSDIGRQQCHLKKSLRGCGFSAKTQDEIFKLISTIMLLGNMEFGEHDVKKEQGNRDNLF
jgi:myosin heavy subunit